MLQLLFLLGLGSVFLINAVVAVVELAGFDEFVAASPIGGLLSSSAWIAPVVGASDLLIGIAVIASHRVEGLRAPCSPARLLA